MSTVVRSLTLLLVATSLPAFTQAEGVDIYGQLHLSIDHLDSDVEGDKAKLNTSSNASRLGLRGQHELDDRFTLFWQAEASVDLVDGGGLSLDRDTYVGLSNELGQLRVGRFDTPYKRVWSRVDFFGNQLGDARNAINVDGLDRRLKSSIHYRSPELSGFVVDLQYATNMKNNATQDSDSQAVSTSIQYQKDQFWAAVAYDNDDANELTSLRLAGSADVGDLRLSVLYQNTERDDPAKPNNKAYGGGLRYKLNDRLALKTQYYKLKLDDETGGIAKLFAMGLDYQYASGLQLYVNYGSLDNDNTYRTAYNSGRTATTSTISTDDRELIGDEKPRGLSVGLTYRF